MFGLQAAAALRNGAGSGSWPEGLSGRYGRALCHRRWLWAEVGGPSCPVPRIANSIPSSCTPSEAQEDPHPIHASCPSKGGNFMGRRSCRPGPLKEVTTIPPVHFPGGSLWFLQIVPSPSNVTEIAFLKKQKIIFFTESKLSFLFLYHFSNVIFTFAPIICRCG